MIGEPYIRKKGKDYIIERKVNGKTEYLSKLPDAKTLLEKLKPGRLNKKQLKASQNNAKNTKINTEKFSYCTLNEQHKDDALEQCEVTQDEIKKALRSLGI